MSGDRAISRVKLVDRTAAVWIATTSGCWHGRSTLITVLIETAHLCCANLTAVKEHTKVTLRKFQQTGFRAVENTGLVDHGCWIYSKFLSFATGIEKKRKVSFRGVDGNGGEACKCELVCHPFPWLPGVIFPFNKYSFSRAGLRRRANHWPIRDLQGGVDGQTGRRSAIFMELWSTVSEMAWDDIGTIDL